MGETFESPTGSAEESAAVAYDPDESAQQDDRSIESVLARNIDSLMETDGVEGVGIGRDKLGAEVIVVYLRDSSVASRVPPEIEGCRVETSVTGIIDAL